jgi:hypothetical protein
MTTTLTTTRGDGGAAARSLSLSESTVCRFPAGRPAQAPDQRLRPTAAPRGSPFAAGISALVAALYQVAGPPPGGR